ncbi:MAG TPA: trigger factor [Mycobacteriales bacterium]|nr:trigger factor [Mycobacteriales bacterium]
MKSTVETLSPTRVRLAVEVPFDELKPSVDKAYANIAKQVRVPGFRPGKAPARIIDQRVGRAAVLDEAVQDALPRAYSDAVRENEVRALGQPEIELTRFDDGESLAFTAEVDVRPEVTLPEYNALPVSVEDIAVGDDEIDEQIAAMRERFAVLKATDRPVQDGDYVSIDLKATVDGEEVPGGSTTGLSYEVGSESMMPGLDEALVGANAGDTREFTTDLVAGDFAGQTAAIAVTVRSVKEKELPELDDDFAQTASEFDTLEEFRADVRSRIERVKTLEQGGQARDKVLTALLESTDVPLPESAVQGEFEWRQHDIGHQLENAGIDMDTYLASEGQSPETFQEQLRSNAEVAVKTQLLLDAIADAEEIGVSDAELTERVIAQAQQYGVSPQEFAQQVTQNGTLPALVADIRRSKALATVLERATITDTSGNTVDLEHLRLSRPDDGETGEAEETPEAAAVASEAGSATSIRPIGP